MKMKILLTIVKDLTFVYIALLTGCTTIPKQPALNQLIVTVTSNPENAEVYLYDAEKISEELLGKTPLRTTISRSGTFQYLLIKLEDYEDGKRWMSKEDTLYHFDLEPDLLQQIFLESQEKGYSKEFKKRVVEVIGACEKAINSPRMLSASVYADANSLLVQLKIDFPETRSYIIVRALDMCVFKLELTVSTGPSLEGTPYERELVKDVKNYIWKIRTPLKIVM